jgi:DNA processing protein
MLFPLRMQFAKPNSTPPFELLEPGSEAYPAGLHRLPTAIPLYCRGRWKVPPEKAIAIVGTRKPTRLGVQWAEDLAAVCARQGWAIVSGLAKGIDGAAHHAALRCQAKTAAVLGCGVDVAYPKSHAGLMQQLALSGALFSEYPPGTPPLRGQFPKRNRIIAALSRAVIVVEAGLDSGALHTAVYAKRMGIPVLVPSALASGPAGMGLKQLLKQGAWGFATCEEAVERLLGATAPIPHRPESRRSQMVMPLFGGEEGDEGGRNRFGKEALKIPETLRSLLSLPGGARLDTLQRHWADIAAAAGKEALAGECHQRLLEWELQRLIARQPDGRFRMR